MTKSKTSKSIYRTLEQMRPMVERYERSGLSRRDYCVAENINVHTFQYWRDKVKQSAANSRVSSSQKQSFQQIHPPSNTKDSMAILDQDTNSHPDKSIQISLTPAIHVELPLTYPTEQLAQLLHYLAKK